MRFDRNAMLDAIEAALNLTDDIEPYMVTAKQVGEKVGISPQTARRKMQANPAFESAEVKVDGNTCLAFWLPEWKEVYERNGTTPNLVGLNAKKAPPP